MLLTTVRLVSPVSAVIKTVTDVVFIEAEVTAGTTEITSIARCYTQPQQYLLPLCNSILTLVHFNSIIFRTT